jgi:hypothetical protein
MMRTTILLGMVLWTVAGCRMPANLQWAQQLSQTSELINGGWGKGPTRVEVSELASRLAMADHGPDAKVPAARLASLLPDEPWLDLEYGRYPDWVMGKVWTQFTTNARREPVRYGWQSDPEFNSCECWLYSELEMPTFGRSVHDLDNWHPQIVYVFLVKDGSVRAATRVEPWRGVHNFATPSLLRPIAQLVRPDGAKG